MKYLPRIDYYIDRENMDSFIPDNKEKVAVIMNGCFLHYTLNWPPSPYIKPLPVSMHFTLTGCHFFDIKNNKNHLVGYGLDYLKSISPIGCRDSHTLELLTKKDVKAEFTGCLTLTLNKFKNVKKQDYICAVDVSKDTLEKIKSSTNLEVKEITHNVPEDYYKLSWEERFRNVEELLKIYQGAKCVITTRLHCGLPCTALGTPVLIIHNKNDDDRFKDYLKFIDFCYEPDFLNGNYIYDFSNPLANKSEHLKIRDNLNKRCINFINDCEQNNLDTNEDDLPEMNFYLNYVINKSNWYKDIISEVEKIGWKQ